MKQTKTDEFYQYIENRKAWAPLTNHQNSMTVPIYEDDKTMTRIEYMDRMIERLEELMILDNMSEEEAAINVNIRSPHTKL